MSDEFRWTIVNGDHFAMYNTNIAGKIDSPLDQIESDVKIVSSLTYRTRDFQYFGLSGLGTDQFAMWKSVASANDMNITLIFEL